MLNLSELETFTIIGYLDMDFDQNINLIVKILRYAQNKGWMRKVNNYIQKRGFSIL